MSSDQFLNFTRRAVVYLYSQHIPQPLSTTKVFKELVKSTAVNKSYAAFCREFMADTNLLFCAYCGLFQVLLFKVNGLSGLIMILPPGR